MKKYASFAVPVPLKRNFIYSFDTDLCSMEPGERAYVPFKGRKLRAYCTEVFDENPLDSNIPVKDVIKQIDKEPVFSEENYSLALWMEKFYLSSRGEILDTMVPGGKREVPGACFDAEYAKERPDVVLSCEQKNAVDRVMNGTQKLYYLFGITGSGKTEVFLNCAKQVIDSGKQVIYLVPEITLTHQLASQVLKRFKDNVAILHSAMTDSQRLTQWKKILRGEVSLIIGARSAVFAPVKNLGLIIIDEEHENSYKSGQDPRYHARQVAQKRILECDAKLLMGSATPSLESWALMQDSAKMQRIDLKTRVGGGRLPTVETVDMKKEKDIFSRQLCSRICETVSRKKQVILFLNRRGFSYYFHCNSCGYEHKCPNCSIAMTYHKHQGKMVCHYCGHTESVMKKCPECGSVDIIHGGFGTEQVEQRIKELFPEFRTARLDSDVAAKDRKAVSAILDDFGKGKYDILIGTQMVAKGLDFPNVELVGLVLADSTLLVPDFRAEERTFDLIVQVSGRSGRSSGDGKVLVQTSMPENEAISFALQGNTEAFMNRELEIRKAVGFPPFSRMLNITIRSKDKGLAKQTAEKISNEIQKTSPSFSVYGAQESAIEKLNNNWRYSVLLRGNSPGEMISHVSFVLDNMTIPANVFVEKDVDPVDLL